MPAIIRLRPVVLTVRVRRSCHPKAALNVFRGGKFYKQVAIGASDSMTFGRDEFKCDHVLVHPSASDIHAMFTHDEHGHLQLIDLGRRTGWVDLSNDVG